MSNISIISFKILFFLHPQSGKRAKKTRYKIY